MQPISSFFGVNSFAATRYLDSPIDKFGHASIIGIFFCSDKTVHLKL